jgi:hypothetical protein
MGTPNATRLAILAIILSGGILDNQTTPGPVNVVMNNHILKPFNHLYVIIDTF